MTPEELKAGFEKLNSAWSAFQEANDKRIADLKKGQDDVLNTIKVDKINAALTDLGAQQEEMRKILNRKGLSEGGEGAEVTAEVKAYSKSFANYIRTGRDEGLQEQARTALDPKAAMTTDSDGSGGYIVDPPMVKRISEIVGVICAMRGLAEVVPAYLYEDSVEQHTTAVTIASEQDSRSETAEPTFKEIRIEAEEMYAEPRVTQKMLDLRPDVESYVAQKVAVALAEKEGLDFISGNGVKQPRGILTYGTVANASYAWGSVGYIASGASGAFAGSNPGDKLLDLVYGLKKQYRQNAGWLLTDLTESVIRKIKDGDGRYLWVPGLTADQSATLLGKPVNTDNNMPELASNSFSIAFGDFFTAYKILDPGMMTILRDPFTAKPFIKLYTTKRTGGGIANFEALKLMKFATS